MIGRHALRVPGGAVLSNGKYTSLVTRRGTGVAFCRYEQHRLQLTGWQPDTVEDHLGWLFYLRDLDSGLVWSPAPAPTPHPSGRYRFLRHVGHVTIRGEMPGIRTDLCAWVDPDLPAEFRQLRIHNASSRPLRCEVTSYLEVVLFPGSAHSAHPAFSKLFVETGRLASFGALVARRRPRAADERWPVLFQAVLPRRRAADAQWETDRARFLGRGRDVTDPGALAMNGALAGTVGGVLDPIFSFRVACIVSPGEIQALDFVLGIAESEREVASRLETWQSPDAVARSRRRAARGSSAQCHRIGWTRRQARQAEELTVALLYRSPSLRPALSVASPASLAVREQLGIGSEDILFAVGQEWDADTRHRLVTYWQQVGLPIHVAVSADDCALPVQASSGATETSANAAGCDPDPSVLAVADGCSSPPAKPVPRKGQRGQVTRIAASEFPRTPESSLAFRNGYGGFRNDGREYVVRLEGGRLPPLPWANVIANKEFGCLITERGGGFTWSHNSREYRLTVWSNDPVIDPPSECVYLRDEKSGAFWSLLPAPCGPPSFEVQHGFGYSRWCSGANGIEHTVTIFVPLEANVRIAWVRLVNRGHVPRTLSLWGYHRLVLGSEPWRSGRFVCTEFDADPGVLWAANPSVEWFSSRTVFCALATRPSARVWASGDRMSFVGVGGTLAAPVALGASPQHGPVGTGLDPAAIVATDIALGAGESWEGAVMLGEAASRSQAMQWIQEMRAPGALARTFADTTRSWRDRLEQLRVLSPDPAVDVLLRGWLLYQATSCRLWGRSAFYQSGGAFGFRDQLQDSCALLWSRPEDTRAQILLHARHQFPEGDVLHWWHPPWERGTRTRFSDDLLWLPLVTAWYVDFTGDAAVLDEPCGFVHARSLRPEEEEAYLSVRAAGERASLYEHCCRAIDRSLTRGPHGLPLMGTGDWNDGMNRVGRGGRGESVWLGFFLADILQRFSPFCLARSDGARDQRYRAYREQLVQALNEAGWDGAWYRRAYFDDGRPLGSAENDECQIDGLVQAWAVLTGVASPERSRLALRAVWERLVDREAKLVRLLAPPFDRTVHDPGYIKGYLPGIRENGGQYTHAAIWMVQAFLRAGQHHEASELLRFLFPLVHAATPAAADIYKVEPYVVVADIYSTEPHRGRGGWTWYTGSAAWLYRLLVEEVLGLRLEQGQWLVVRPQMPDAWPGFQAEWKIPGTTDVYDIEVVRSDRGFGGWVDDRPIAVQEGQLRLRLFRDGARHRVRLVVPAS